MLDAGRVPSASGRLAGRRICMILTNGYRPDVRVEKEAKALAEEGATITIFAWDRTGSKAAVERVAERVTVRREAVLSSDGIGARQLPRLLRYCQRVGGQIRSTTWDAIHAHDLDGLLAGVMCNRASSKLVYDAHEVYPLLVADRLGSLAGKGAWLLERVLRRRTDLVITDGRRRAQVMRRVFGSSPVIVENTAEVARFANCSKWRPEKRAELRIPADAWVIGIFTGLNRGWDAGLLPGLLEMLPDAYGVVAGAGAESKKVAELAESHPRLRYLGFVHDIVPWYGAVDNILYLMDPMSRNARFGFPNNVASAVAAGVPIVVLDIGECAYLVRRYGIGPVVKNATVPETLAALLQLRSKPYYRQCVQAMRTARHRFDWSTSRQTLIDAYCSLLS